MNDNEFKIIEGLIRNLSHEIKNPLTTIKGYTQLLAARPDDANLLLKSQRSILEQIERIDIMLKMLYDIFSLHADTDALFDAAEIIENTLKFTERAGSVKFESAVTVRPWIIKGNADLFSKMIMLMVDGFDWENNPGASVEITAHTAGLNSWIDLFFRGIDFSDLNEQLFYLPYSSKKHYKNGTELYEVYAISHLHGWSFSILTPDNPGGFKIEF